MDINKIENLGLDRILKRGSGEVLAEQDDALLIRDRVSGAYMLACEDTELGIRLLEKHCGGECNLLMVSNEILGREAFERFNFSEMMDCYQVAYFGEKPVPDDRISVRVADEHDLPMLIENYDMISPDELKEVVNRKNILLGYSQERLIGFIGEHLEGSMGILYVFPEYRHKGFGSALQSHFIIKTMEEGNIPFGQVEKENHASLCLQKKLGMSRSDNLIVWMWK